MGRHELAIDEICGPAAIARVRGRGPRAPSHRAFQAHRPYQPTHRASCHAEPFATQLFPDLARPVHLMMLIIHPLNLRAQRIIALCPGRAPRRIDLRRPMAVIRRGGDRQHGADRLNPALIPMVVNEANHHFPRRSSSAWATYADAFRRISFARFSSRTSRSSSLRRSRSLVVNPWR